MTFETNPPTSGETASKRTTRDRRGLEGKCTRL